MKTLLGDGKRRTGIMLVAAGLLIILIKLISTSPDLGLRILVAGTGESINGTPQQKVALYYSAEIANMGSETFMVHSVEPVLEEAKESLLVDENAQKFVYNQELKAGEVLEIEGTFELNTSGLKEEEVTALLPYVTAYKVKYNNIEQIFNIYHIK
ncbi:hypothetical protein M3231_14440 [Neobacillus mesonae]|nr:hypothetical protein [Neobacillus mesonae]